jgi:hypothetical protein
MDIRFRFESAQGTWVPVLSNSTIAAGNLVSQNAGSSLSGLYYQVGGGYQNGIFATAIGNTPATGCQLDQANTALEAAYDHKFGAGAFDRDSKSVPADPPLTSFYIPIDAAKCFNAGTQLVGMLYSVGPQLTSAEITDEPQYRRIYTDGFTAIVNANAGGAQIKAVRISMVSTGVFAGNPTPAQRTALLHASARLILDGIVEAAVAAAEANFPGTVLVNVKGSADAAVDAFTHAANCRDLPGNSAGFDLSAKTLS